jgi:hypothetical protein
MKLTLYDNEDNLRIYDLSFNESVINGSEMLSIQQNLFNNPIRLEFFDLNPSVGYVNLFKNVTELQIPECENSTFTMELGRFNPKKLSICLKNQTLLYNANFNNTQIISYNSTSNSSNNNIGLIDGKLRYVADNTNLYVVNKTTLYPKSMDNNDTLSLHSLSFKITSDQLNGVFYSTLSVCLNNINETLMNMFVDYDINRCASNQYNNTNLLNKINQFILNSNENYNEDMNNTDNLDTFYMRYYNQTSNLLSKFYQEGNYIFNWKTIFDNNVEKAIFMPYVGTLIPKSRKLQNLSNNSSKLIRANLLDQHDTIGLDHYPGSSFDILFYILISACAFHTLMDFIPKVMNMLFLKEPNKGLNFTTALMVFNAKLQILVSMGQILGIGITAIGVQNHTPLIDNYHLKNLFIFSICQVSVRLLNLLMTFMYRCKNEILKYNHNDLESLLENTISSNLNTFNPKPLSFFTSQNVDIVYNNQQINLIREILKEKKEISQTNLFGLITKIEASLLELEKEEQKVSENFENESSNTAASNKNFNGNKTANINVNIDKKAIFLQLILFLRLIEISSNEGSDIKGEPFIDQHNSLMHNLIKEISNEKINDQQKNQLFQQLKNMLYTGPQLFSNTFNFIMESTICGLIITLYNL